MVGVLDRGIPDAVLLREVKRAVGDMPAAQLAEAFVAVPYLGGPEGRLKGDCRFRVDAFLGSRRWGRK
jgi:hypothetical protein